MKICDNYESKIWLGLRSGYTDHYSSTADVCKVIKDWCTEKKQCVSVSKTDFIYVQTDETGRGEEPGLVIGFINYPRYQLSQAELRNRTIELGKLLMEKFNQYRVSLTFYPSVPGGTMMLENEDMK